MASLCIGQLYHARRFEDDDMKEQIINYLTALSKIEDDNSVVQKFAVQTLKNLLPYQKNRVTNVCIWHIQGSNISQDRILREMKFLKLEIEGVSCAGGSEEEDYCVIINITKEMKSVEEPHNEKYVAGSKSSCAVKCHKDHKIKFLGMEIFECQCGVRNEQKCKIPCIDLSIASEKSDSEENSIASQNSIDSIAAEYDDFEIVQKLFGGVMGNTFLVMLKTTGKLFVMKRVDYLDEKDKMKADEEVEQIRRLSSKFT
ncbi:MAG: hypothetical protein EZS28_033088, partial [Streblomastix strix]